MSDRREGRRPQRFDPEQRGRDFTRERRRKGRHRRSTERRVETLETWSYLNISVATQPPSNSLIEVVEVLPEPSYLDIGRQIILRSPEAEKDILYVGMLQADDTVAWVQWTASYEDEIPGSPDFVFDQHVVPNTSPVVSPNGISSTSSAIYFTPSISGFAVIRYLRSTGGQSFPVAGIPSSGNVAQGVYSDGTSIWVGVPTNNKIEYWNGSVLAASTTLTDYWALYNDPVSGAIFATDFANHSVRKINKTTLALISTITGSLSGPQGVATDSAGNVYVADTGHHQIRKYNSSLTFLSQWGSLGTAEGQFSSPKGMAFDTSDRLHVCDSGNNRIQIFDTSGNFLGKFGSFGGGPGQLSNPVDISIAGALIDIADRGNVRLSLWRRV